MSIGKLQRVRDPLHNLIEFGPDQFEQTLWRVIETRPFQRLRRVRQLGFSELVFPGATHTRFSHSLGVFHTARQLIEVIKRHAGYGGVQPFRDQQAREAVAAALVHDVGHGMFSHAFEEIGHTLGLPMARHELVSDRLIRDGEIAEAFREMGSGFASDVADVIKRGRPGNLYHSVVSSQFDADRLDYMQRDRLMTGVQSSGIDATWLMANLEIASVPTGPGEGEAAHVETLVLGRKASHVAESYVLSLFQLYPNIYFHKATRSAEKVFAALMLRVIQLAREGQADKTGLPRRHPILRFAENPEDLENALGLDDAVFWGVIGLLAEADDPVIKVHADRLRLRQLPKCVDVRQRFEVSFPRDPNAGQKANQRRNAIVQLRSRNVLTRMREWAAERPVASPAVLIDQARRAPYKKRDRDSQDQLNQLLIRVGTGRVHDMAEMSAVVANAETFEVGRVYLDKDDAEAKRVLENIMRTESEGNADVDA